MKKQIILFFLFPIQLPFIGLFFIISPLIFLYCVARYLIKKKLNLQPTILFSPLALPRNYLTAKGVISQSFVADVLVYNKNKTFEDQAWGFSLEKHPILKIFLFLTDFLPVFVYVLIKYDIFEFSFWGGPLIYSKLRKIELLLFKIFFKKTVVYGYGSDALLLSEIKGKSKYNAAMDFKIDQALLNHEKIIKANIKRTQKFAHAMLACNDLIGLGKRAIMVPTAIDLKQWQPTHFKHEKKIYLLHSTNHRIYKGTRFILKAVSELKKEGLPIELILVEGKSFKECVQLYKKADIFIPNVITGWSGLSQIEGMAMGKPVISYIKPEIAKFHNYYARSCPIINANPDNLKEAIIKLVKNPEFRKKVGQKGLEYASRYHSLEFTGKLRVAIYEKIWRGEPINQKIFEKLLEKRGII